MYKVHDFKVLVCVLNEVHTSSFSLSMNGNLFCRKYVHHEKMTHFYRIPNTSFVILKESSSKSKESFYYKLDGNSYMLVFSCTHTQISYGLFMWSDAKNLRNICEIFAKYSQKIRENSQKFCQKFVKNSRILIFREFFANFLRIFCEFFANISQIFHKYFVNISRKFCEFFASDHVKSPLLTIQQHLCYKFTKNFKRKKL